MTRMTPPIVIHGPTDHGKEIYKNPKWPTKPLFYLSVPSVTDDSVAPAGHENLFFLVPIAPDLKDDDATREYYFEISLNAFLVRKNRKNRRKD